MKEFKNLSPIKKFYSISLLFLILGMICFVAVSSKQIQTITYQSGCEEIFIDGVINGSYCQDERDFIDSQNRFQNIIKNNLENIKIE